MKITLLIFFLFLISCGREYGKKSNQSELGSYIVGSSIKGSSQQKLSSTELNIGRNICSALSARKQRIDTNLEQSRTFNFKIKYKACGQDETKEYGHTANVTSVNGKDLYTNLGSSSLLFINEVETIGDNTITEICSHINSSEEKFNEVVVSSNSKALFNFYVNNGSYTYVLYTAFKNINRGDDSWDINTKKTVSFEQNPSFNNSGIGIQKIYESICNDRSNKLMYVHDID